MALHGIDVSSYQLNYNPGPGEDFIFIKASEGTSYRNPYRTAQAQNARAKGLVVGWYHFLHPGNILPQAAFFVATSGIGSGDLLVCDWEYSGCTNDDKDSFIRAVQHLRPNAKVGLYCNTSWWKNVDKTSFCGDFLWIAAYGVSDPGIQAAYKFWQYTDKPVDQNHGYFDSRAALKAWAAGTPAPAPKPTPTPDPAPAPAPKPTSNATDLWTIKRAHAYDANGRRRIECDLPKGYKHHGVVDTKKFNDGRYFRLYQKPHRLWFPLDGGAWSHTKGGKPITAPKKK